MKLLYKDQLIKIKQNLFYFISISLLVMIISLTYTSVKTSVDRLEDNYANYLQEQNTEDFYFALNNFDITYLTARQQLYMCQQLDILIECSLVDFDDGVSVNSINTLISGLLEENLELYNEMTDVIAYGLADSYDLTIEKAYVTTVTDGDYIYKFHSVTQVVSVPYIVEGELPVKDFDIAVFPEFAKANNIAVGDTLSINSVDYTVVGFMYKAEYTFPLLSMSTLEYDELHQTIVLASKDTITEIDEFIFNKYLGTGDIGMLFNDFGFEDILGSDLSFLGKNMQMVSVIMPSSLNFRIISLPKEVDNAIVFINIFITVFSVFISALLIVFMKRYIDKNKEDINTLYALGYNNREITKMLMVFPVIISLNSVIGYIIGLVLSNSLFDLYGARYLFPKSGFTLSLDIFVIAVVIPISLIIIVNLIFITRALKVKKKGLYKKIFKSFKFTPFKTVFITALLFLGINIMIIFSVSGNNMFTSFVDYTREGNNYEYKITLHKFIDDDLSDSETEFSKAVGLVESVNGEEITENNKLTIYGIDYDNSMKLLIDNDIDNNQLLEDGIIVSQYTASMYDIAIGDSVTYSVGKAMFSEVVVGIGNELVENSFFTSRERLNALYELDGTYYNGIFTTDPDFDHSLTKSSLNYNRSVDEFSSLLGISSMIMSYLLFLSSFLSLYILGLIIFTYLNDNNMNFAILKSIGYTNFEINKLYLKNIIIAFVLMFIISIPLTKYLIDIVLDILMRNLGFQLVLDLNSSQLLISFILISTMLFFTVTSVNKYLNRVNISIVMQKNIK